jgi:diguanylate cyclase
MGAGALATSGLWLILCLVSGAFVFAAGAVFGYWWVRRQPAIDESAQAREMMKHLSQLAVDLNGDCSNYQRLVSAVSEEVDRMGESSDTSALRQMLDELNVANQDLRQKLGVMRSELDGKTQEVQTLVSESRTDVLTGLPNRRCFNENMQHRISELGRHGGELSFAILDVDFFKKFNDTYGHLLGDEVLRTVSKAMQETVRDSDVAVRLGGEEFGVLLPGVGLMEAGRAADRFRQAIERCGVPFEGKMLKVTASFGVTQVLATDHVEHVLERADQALYAAKDGGRNAVWLWDDGEFRPYLKKPGTVPVAMKKSSDSLRESLLATIED